MILERDQAMDAKRSAILLLIMSVAVGLMGCGVLGSRKSGKYALRVNCAGKEKYVDQAGNEWSPDQYIEQSTEWGAVDGLTVDRGDLGIDGVAAPKVYQTERYNMSAYIFKLPNGRYRVRLHFAETYDGMTDVGQRVFSVTINGQTVLHDFDPHKEAGGLRKPVIKEIDRVVVRGGELTIGFVKNIQNPEINGIEILGQ